MILLHRKCVFVLLALGSHHMKFYSGSTGLCEMATVDNDGRKRRYRPGPINGINEIGRSQEPLSNLHNELALKYIQD